jgi:hypothetical protein
MLRDLGFKNRDADHIAWERQKQKHPGNAAQRMGACHPAYAEVYICLGDSCFVNQMQLSFLCITFPKIGSHRVEVLLPTRTQGR